LVQEWSATSFQDWTSMAHQQSRSGSIDQRQEEEKQSS
jgi:hypothetical protein